MCIGAVLPKCCKIRAVHFLWFGLYLNFWSAFRTLNSLKPVFLRLWRRKRDDMQECTTSGGTPRSGKLDGAWRREVKKWLEISISDITWPKHKAVLWASDYWWGTGCSSIRRNYNVRENSKGDVQANFYFLRLFLFQYSQSFVTFLEIWSID